MLSGVWPGLAIVLTLQSTPAPVPAPPALAEVAAWPDDKPFSRILQNLGHDLVSLPSPDTLIVVGAGGLGALAISGADDNAAEWAAESKPSFSRLGSVFGDGWMQGTVAGIAYITGRVNGDVKTTHVASDLIRAQVLNGVITSTLKVAVGRERPNGGEHSFPSGHTSATFASAAVLNGHFGWKVGVPGYAIAGLVGWTRIRDRSHWVSDAVFGAAIGLAAGRTVTAGHRARTWTVVPTSSPTRVAVFVVRTR